ncbi:type IV pilin [Natrinema amylolyticum]|uniref:type IV pilin n=1 Tax=Natrinema amylolyticum TaxID=2878679 RepID=UPI001CFB97B1|nr:type IV pilin N-terminal domain-containing protein [Natrinema amylolyticum]
MDLKGLKPKLVGSDDERAVSPVIGVILMVAITVILAAVIAAFVLDMGGSIGEEANAGVNIEVDEANNESTLEVTSMGNSDQVKIRGNAVNASNLSDGALTLNQSGDVRTYSHDEGNLFESGTISAVAVINESETETQVASETYDFTSS